MGKGTISHNEISCLCRYWMKQENYSDEAITKADYFIYNFTTNWNGSDSVIELKEFFIKALNARATS